MASPQHPAGTPSPTSRPGPSGMSQGTYTGNVSFSRGTTDLISKGANLPSMGAGVAPATPAKVTQPSQKGGIYGLNGTLIGSSQLSGKPNGVYFQKA